jgi:hypothetical protein
MRFLVVYQNFSKPAQEVVDRLGVEDVTVLIVRKDEREACDEVVDELKAHPNAPTALCHIHRKYKKSIASLVDIQCEIKGKKFRPDDQVLMAWLRPPETVEESFDKPSTAMVAASASAEHLVIADGALEHADKVAQHRWRFASRSADILARYAGGESLGPLRNWKEQHGVEFATNGRVRYEYRVISKGKEVKGSTEWHLKEGDNTTRESAARIYFARVEVGGDEKVLVFYVGPHPSDGSYSVKIDCDGQ